MTSPMIPDWRAFWHGFLHGVALPLLWLMRLPLVIGCALCMVAPLLSVPSAKIGRRLMRWDDAIAAIIKGRPV